MEWSRQGVKSDAMIKTKSIPTAELLCVYGISVALYGYPCDRGAVPTQSRSGVGYVHGIGIRRAQPEGIRWGGSLRRVSIFDTKQFVNNIIY